MVAVLASFYNSEPEAIYWNFFGEPYEQYSVN